MEIKTDFLILGSGIAGLTYALKVSQYGSVEVRGSNPRSSTIMAG